MKRIAAFLALSLVTLVLPAHADEASPIGTVTAVSGSTAIAHRGSLIPAAQGMQVRKGDLVRSGKDGTLDVSLNDLAGCRLLAGTELDMQETKPSDMRLNVKSGNVILNLQKLPHGAKFRVETPTAVASVRGTQFWGRVDSATGDTVTTFAVREGAVDVLAKGAGRNFRLKPGQALDIPKNGKPTARQALPDEMQAMEQATTVRTAA
jgi:hypothetical protein